MMSFPFSWLVRTTWYAINPFTITQNHLTLKFSNDTDEYCASALCRFWWDQCTHSWQRLVAMLVIYNQTPSIINFLFTNWTVCIVWSLFFDFIYTLLWLVGTWIWKKVKTLYTLSLIIWMINLVNAIYTLLECIF